MRVLHQDAGDHKGPPRLPSAALAPTEMMGFLRLMPLWDHARRQMVNWVKSARILRVLLTFGV